MKIGIYARGLSERVGGVKEYIKLMTQELINNVDKNDQLYIFHNSNQQYFENKKANAKEIILKSKNKLFCDFLAGPQKINRLNLDVIWFPKNVIPFFIKAKKIVTVHDLAYFLPQYHAYKTWDTIYMKIMLRSSCHRADKIIADSENTKKDIQKILKIKASKIEIIYPGIDRKYKSIKNKRILNRVREKYHLPQKFIFFPGSITPRKNLIRLIKAFNKISKEKDCKLVITGSKRWGNQNLLKLIQKNQNIKILGFIKAEDMPVLYNLAKLCVYPSLYEGFGLPILEAQACFCPVVCSYSSALPEIGGKGVHYINPYDDSDIAAGMTKVLNNRNYRKQLINEGRKNIKRFQLQKVAKTLLKEIKKTGEKKR